ncbi:NrfD/PsrC family molybdoenzyme membrane anchor subunit [Adlercreutzia sp. R21]|uniref:NrfD/PsrC family molybdoenzyme membrane anchor subunit n=1 Tax=Adlercreutzia wanghongyangiae TaxID=3111451 RepID=UPI002DB7CD0C|nr:NrfD/PsrC family molybdoenzyme membrane anchor subunit [Adlercreutzia sp. R21]MEC4184588.1 NrfD/PsrC family molybdoenzyme membrane anchor subunit [Adlercreutzia sp. R21]
MLGSFVVLYLFLGGCGAGVLLTATAWSLLFHCTRTRTRQQTCAFAMLLGRLYATGFVLLVVAALCLLLDLGRPQRFLLLFLRPTPSLLSVGSFLLLAALLTAGLLTALRFVGTMRSAGWVRRALEVVCSLLAVGLMVYTGLYMAWMEAVPLWNNAALPLLLALSSASSGVAVVLLAVPFARDNYLLGGWTGALHRLHRVLLILECATLAAFLGLALSDPFARPSLLTLLSPDAEGLWFAVGFGGFGIVAPLGAEVARGLLGRDSPLLVAEVLCVAGGLILRFCLVLAGSHWLG